jgi:hypothetical protein
MMEFVGWRHERRAFNRIRCTPPDGEDLAEIVIHERVRPLTSLRTLVERVGADGAIDPAVRLATAEGELAAIVSFDAAGQHRTLGAIFGDDFQTIVDGRTARADQRERIRAVAREIVVQLPLGLGEKRHRRFWYSPPPGWQAVARGLVTDWFPLDHPLNPATIKVLPARPLDAMFHIDTFVRDDTFGDVKVDEITHTPLALAALKGTLARATAGERVFLTAALEDRRYVYVLRLKTTIDRLVVDEAILQDMLRSCVPVPRPAADRLSASTTHALDYWAL